MSKNTNNQFFITESNCLTLCIPKIGLSKSESQSSVFVFNPGEKNKNSSSFLKAIEFLASKNASRDALLINVGGGVTTDLGGYIAASYKRGISFINIPTSLMGMVDASHGGKVGINHGNLKNYIGAFVNASHIYICTDFLKTLPEQELISGFAEILKHGLISDKTYWTECSNIEPTELSSEKWLPIVKKSIDIKSAIVNDDFKEQNIRKILNFGHTIGHSIESHFLKHNKNITHGQAVASGMIMEAYISNKLSTLPEIELNEIESTIDKTFERVAIEHKDIDELLSFIKFDKKNKAGNINMSLLKSIGVSKYDRNVSHELIKEALEFYIAGNQ